MRVSRDLPLEDVEIETPLVKTTLKTLAGKSCYHSDSACRTWNG